MAGKNIRLYAPGAFTARYMPSEELQALFKGDIDRFLMVRVEEMYRHVQQAVPASKATGHTCIFLTEGEANMKIGSESYTISGQQLLFVPAGQVFSFDTQDRNKGYLCSFHDKLLTGKWGSNKLPDEFEFLKIWGNPKIVPDAACAGFILQLLQRLHLEYSTRGLERIELLQSYFIALLREINTAYLSPGQDMPSAAVQLTRRFREQLTAQIATVHRVTEYAALLHVSPNHLNKAVKRVSGKTPIRWIEEAIITEARILLWQTDMSVSTIALELGFEDPSYFARLFKKLEGCSPSAYRNGLKSPG